VFGGGDGIAGGRVHYGYTSPGRRVDINIVYASTSSTYCLKTPTGVNQVRRNLSTAAHEESVIARDQGLELRWRQIRMNVDCYVISVQKRLQSAAREFIAN
jgi:hypothetical protein